MLDIDFTGFLKEPIFIKSFLKSTELPESCSQILNFYKRIVVATK